MGANQIVSDFFETDGHEKGSFTYELFWCVCHRLELVVRAGLESFAPFLERVTKLVKYFHSYKKKNELQGVGVTFKLAVVSMQLESITRWWSQYDMLVQVQTNKEALKRCLSGSENQTLLLTNNEWATLNKLLVYLEPWAEAVKTLEGAKPETLGKCFPFLTILQQHLEDNTIDNDLKELQADMSAEFAKKFTGLTNTTPIIGWILRRSTILTPQLKDLNFLETDRRQEVMNEFRTQYEKEKQEMDVSNNHSNNNNNINTNNHSNNNNSNINNKATSCFQKAFNPQRTSDVPKDEIADYLNMYVSEEQPFVEFWQQNRERLPVLAKMVRKVFGFLPSESSSERVFTKKKSCGTLKKIFLVSVY